MIDLAMELKALPEELIARMDAAGTSIPELQAHFSMKNKARAQARQTPEIQNRPKLPPPKKPGRR